MSTQAQRVVEKHSATADQLQQHAWFASLPHETLIALAPLFSVETYPNGGLVFSKYQPANSLYLVLSGGAEFMMFDRGRNTDHYTPAPKNSVFGEVGFFQAERQRTAPAEVSEGTVLLVLERAQFAQAVALAPILSDKLCEVMANRLTALDEKIRNSAYIGPFQN